MSNAPKSGFREQMRKVFPVVCAYYLYDDFRAARRFASGKIETDSGTTHTNIGVDESVAYVREVFEDYKRYSGVERFHGRIAEVGPGDNCGVGLLFLNDGCESVDLVDRFYSKRNAVQQAGIYRELLVRYPDLKGRLGACDINSESSFSGTARHYGQDASAEEFFAAHKGYDYIVSRAVLEHVFDPPLAIKRMAEALNPGGMLLHKVDLRDHGMFSNHFHELKFLEVSDWMYGPMTRASGRPNRILVDRYRGAMKETGLEYKILVTRLAGAGDINPHLRYEDIASSLREQSATYVRSVRGQFANSLRSMRDEDLAIAGFFLVARKKS